MYGRLSMGFTLDEPGDQHVQVVLSCHCLDPLENLLENIQRLFIQVHPLLLLPLRH